MNLTKLSLFAGLASATVIFQALPASAFTTFTDRTAWESAIGDFETETFDGNSINQTVSDFGDFTILGRDNDEQGGVIKVDGGAIVRGETVKFTFDSPIKGFFADWGTFGGNERVGPQVRIVGNFDGTGEQTINFYDLLPDTGRQRQGPFGLIGDAMFSEFELIRNADRAPDNFSIDNFSYGGPQDVPEPMSSMALLAVGVIGAGSALKKKLAA